MLPDQRLLHADDSRFDAISDPQLEAAADAGDQIAQAHLRLRHRQRARRKRQRAAAEEEGGGAAQFQHLPESGSLAVWEPEPEPRELLIDDIRPASASALAAASRRRRRSSTPSGSSSLPETQDVPSGDGGSSGPSSSAVALQTIPESCKAVLLESPRRALGGSGSGVGSTSHSPPVSYLDVKSLGSAIDVLLMRPPSVSNPGDRDGHHGDEQDEQDKSTSIASGQDVAANPGTAGPRLLRITDDPFTSAMSLLPSAAGAAASSSATPPPPSSQCQTVVPPPPPPQGAMAKLIESRRKNTTPPPPPHQPPHHHHQPPQSELFSDVARLTSLDIRKTLAREAKQLRLSREAQQQQQVPPNVPLPLAPLAPRAPPETKAERRARREKRREDRARSRLEVAWREEMAEREAIAPPNDSAPRLEDQDRAGMGLEGGE
jgi:hypothetical protein